MSTKSGAIKSYARALFELGLEKDQLAVVAEEFKAAVELIEETPELRNALTSHLVADGDKHKLVATLVEKMQLSTTTGNFFRLLAVKGRLVWVSLILQQFLAMVDEQNGILRGTVTTAEKVSEEQIKDLERAFGKKFSRTVVLDAKEDKGILGGLVVKIQDLTFDGSLKTSLQQLKKKLERQYV